LGSATDEMQVGLVSQHRGIANRITGIRRYH
jgi:hypothetical protein